MQRKNRPLPYIGTARTTGTAAIIAPPSQPSPKSRSGGIDSSTPTPGFLCNPSTYKAPIGYIRRGMKGVGGDRSQHRQDVARHDQMVDLVERMLDLRKRLAKTEADHEKTLLQRRIEATDKQIDRLIYELYELTEEEIKIVEETST